MTRAFELLNQALVVLTSVYFDYQPRSQAYEVRDVRSERSLPAESITAQATVAKESPQQTLGICRVAT